MLKKNKKSNKKTKLRVKIKTKIGKVRSKIKATVAKAVPKSKMSPKELEQYRKTLLAIKEQISGQIKQISSDAATSQKDTLGDASGHALHMADVATDMYDREFSLGLASNDRELLYQVEEALGRIENRVFGLCLDCGRSITGVRLKAIPYAQTCLKCQEKLEKK